jgi:hypothetical protein
VTKLWPPDSGAHAEAAAEPAEGSEAGDVVSELNSIRSTAGLQQDSFVGADHPYASFMRQASQPAGHARVDSSASVASAATQPYSALLEQAVRGVGAAPLMAEPSHGEDGAREAEAAAPAADAPAADAPAAAAAAVAAAAAPVSAVSPALAAPSPGATSEDGGSGGGGGGKALDKRTRIVKEIVETEEAYVRKLSLVVDDFLSLLQNNVRAVETGSLPEEELILSTDKQERLFSNLRIIRDLNRNFLQSLQERFGAWGEASLLGDLFLNFGPFFKMYTEYVNNHDKATHLLKRFREERKYARFQQAMSKLEQQYGLDLASFLIMPIQRVPRYKVSAPGQTVVRTCPPPARPDSPSSLRAAVATRACQGHR